MLDCFYIAKKQLLIMLASQNRICAKHLLKASRILMILTMVTSIWWSPSRTKQQRWKPNVLFPFLQMENPRIRKAALFMSKRLPQDTANIQTPLCKSSVLSGLGPGSDDQRLLILSLLLFLIHLYFQFINYSIRAITQATKHVAS